MRNYLNIIYSIFFILLSLTIASSKNLNYSNISTPECDPAFGLLKFDFKAIDFPANFAGETFKLTLQGKDPNETYISLCKIEKKDLLKEVATSSNNVGNVTLTCRLQNITNETKSVDLILSMDILGGESLNLTNKGNDNNSISFQFSKCELEKNENYKYNSELGINIRQANKYNASIEENKITFVLSAFVSQYLPQNYTFPIFDYIPKEGKNTDPLRIGLCKLCEKVEVSENQILGAVFVCEMKYENVSIIYKENFRPMLNGYIGSPEKYINPAQVDISIENNRTKDVSKEPVPPIFSPESISSDKCQELGLFTIKGKFNENFEKGKSFKAILMSENELKCSFDKVEKDKDTEINCTIYYSDLNNSKIALPTNSIFDEGNELFLFKSILSKEDNIKCKAQLPDLNYNNTDLNSTEFNLSDSIELNDLNTSDIPEFNLSDSIELNGLNTSDSIDFNGTEFNFSDSIELNDFNPSDNIEFNNTDFNDTDFEGNGTEIIFRQVCKFRILPHLRRITFFFFGIINYHLRKGRKIIMKIRLIRNGVFVFKNSTCTAKEEFDPKERGLIQADFECSIEGLNKTEEYTGLEVDSSDSITGLPTNQDLLNPASVDDLIMEGDVKDYSIEENKNATIPVFNSTSIDTTDSEKTGIFYIVGIFPPRYRLLRTIQFEIFLISGQKAKCTIPKITEDQKEIRIECESQEELKNSTIEIAPCIALEGFNEIIRLNRVSSVKKVNISNAKEIKIVKNYNINLSFGQLLGFRPISRLITFFFVGFVSQPIKKGNCIKMKVNIIRKGKLVEEEANCTAKEDINPENGAQKQADFDCKVENIENSEECTGLELVSSPEISGIPTEPDLLNPAKVDELIESGEIKNYTSEEFKKNDTIPVFNATSIDTNNSEKTGVFVINGKIPPTYESKKKIEFEVILLTGEKAICTLPKISKNTNEIKIECILQQVVKETKIMIQQFVVLDGYNQIMRFNKIEAEKEVNIANGKEITIEKRFNNSISFGQINSFIKKEKSITFIFAGFATKPIKKDEIFKIDMKLFKKKKEDDDDDDEDEDDDEDKDDDDSEDEEAICTPKEDVTPDNGQQKLVLYDCAIEDIEDMDKFKKIEISSTAQINGIPKSRYLRNPAKVDILIKNNQTQNCTSPEYIKEEIPVFNATTIDTTNSQNTGVFVIVGEVPPKYKLEKKIEFDIILLTGEKAICTFPKVNENQKEIKIECVLQQKIKDTQIIISQFGALDGYKEFIRFNKICTPTKVTIANGREKKFAKLFDIFLSFGQLRHFVPKKNLISFLFYGLTSKPIKKDTSITMVVNVIKNGKLLEQEANCTAKNDSVPKEGKQIQAEFDCKIENITDGDSCTGLELVSSEEISGIPTDPNLLNPVIVDELIIEGELKNYTEEAPEKEPIPEFNATSIDTTDSANTGIIIINGKLLSEYKPKKDIEFEIVLMSGEKVKCKLPKKNCMGEIKIECVLQQEINTQIMISQFVVMDGFDEIMRIGKISTPTKVKV